MILFQLFPLPLSILSIQGPLGKHRKPFSGDSSFGARLATEQLLKKKTVYKAADQHLPRREAKMNGSFRCHIGHIRNF